MSNLQIEVDQDNVQTKQNLESIVQILVQRRKESFSLLELSKYLEEDRRKLSDLENGKCFDLFLLNKYAGILGYDLEFNILERL